MRLSLAVRRLLVATWEVDAKSAARALPAGVDPARVDGKHVVSLFALRAQRSRFQRVPIPGFSQLNVGTYVRFRDERAGFFLLGRVTPGGLGAVTLGLPYAPARLDLREGAVDAPGLGVSLRYDEDQPAEPGPVERAELGLVEMGTPRAFRIRHADVSWARATLVEEPRLDVLLALGFDVGAPTSLLYARDALFEVELPARKVRISARRSDR